METMRAIEMRVFGGPEVLQMEEVPRPEIRKNEALIRVRDAGVNPIDWKLRTGFGSIRLPLIPGCDVAGDIEEIDAGISHLKPGDAVYGFLESSRDGAYAEYVAAPAAYLALKPISLDYVQAAALPLPVLVAWQTLFEEAKLVPGQTVFIHGAAGGIGHLAVQLAKWKGARVIGTAVAKDIDFVQQLGADEVIDYQKKRFDDFVSNVDIVLDVIGGETQERSWKILKKGGILISTVGIASKDAPEKYGVRAKAFVAHPDGGQLAQIAVLIDSGKLKPVVSSVLPLADAAQAQELIHSGQLTRGKVVLKVRD
jgi:NADPH:quinone reductase-like Zn-dependent oxidoreductase